MTSKNAIFIVRTEPAGEEASWNKWLNTVHIPARLSCPGFRYAQRFVTSEVPRYMNLYVLDNTDVMNGEAYQAVRKREAAMPPDSHEAQSSRQTIMYRNVYEPVLPEGANEYAFKDARLLFTVGTDIPAEHEAEYNTWFATEHYPRLIKVPGVLKVQRLMATATPISGKSGRPVSGPKYMAVVEIENEGVIQSEAFQTARATPWGNWLKSLYKVSFRCIYKRIL